MIEQPNLWETPVMLEPDPTPTANPVGSTSWPLGCPAGNAGRPQALSDHIIGPTYGVIEGHGDRGVYRG